MNKRFDPKISPMLSTVIDNIEATLKCPKFKKYRHLIDIDTWQNIENKMPRNENIAKKGFGFCISNFFEYGDFKRIIIINMEKCEKLNLTEGEIAAIVYHELGHLLNGPELTVEPSITFCVLNYIKYDHKLYEEIRNDNSIKEEIFADSYANQNNYGVELISTFHKHNQHFDEKIGHFEIRVEKINSKELFSGSVRPIERNDWY